MGKFNSLENAVKGKKVFVFGAGGGGDIAGSYYISNKIKNMGGNPIVGSIVWERFSIDPIPGPIPLETMINVEPIGYSSALVNSDSYALRYGREIEPQITKLVKMTGEKAVFIDISKGEIGVRKAIEDVRDNLDVDLVIGVDVGGDILALGCEDSLWSPLADSISLSALYSSDIEKILVVFGPGADGELDTNLILKYISEIAKNDGLIGIYGINKDEEGLLENLVSVINTEASLMPLLAFKGEFGEKYIRDKTRVVRLSPILSTFYAIDVDVAFNRSELPKLVLSSGGIGNANQSLNDRCIYTELDLENDLMRLKGISFDKSIDINEIREKGINRLIKSNCNPVKC
ncbi:MAG: DUF1152 domain-containing protein [Caldisphaera sp.]|jgi:hypothetical protein|nr:MAG: hypothetical protein C0201_02420 [Caldisphaera sp.]PMP89645.1 MAG: hypothetical protein C0171_06750 [Caldisphaera sp.]